MSTRAIAALLVLSVAAVAVAYRLVGSGGTPYEVKLQLADAGGLRDGSRVVIGGIDAGSVKLGLDRNRDVVATLRIDKRYAPIGKDARATIAALNLLGQKRVELAIGNRQTPAPDGYVLAASRVSVGTDLDQVLSVLDANTRAQLAVLINEAGLSLTGRREDFSHILDQLPPALGDAKQLLDSLVTDNTTLADVVAHGNGVVTEFASQRRALAQAIDVSGQAAATVAARRVALRQVLAKAPGTLTTLRGFLQELEATTKPLGPAAREITAAAPQLDQTLTQLGPFTSAAAPAFNRGLEAAPGLVKLARDVRPTLQRAVPTASALTTLFKTSPALSDTLNLSADNLVGSAGNWGQALQQADGLSHIFRGSAAISPDLLAGYLHRYEATQGTDAKKTSTPAAGPGRQSAGGHGSGPGAPAGGSGSPKTPTVPVPSVIPGVLGGPVGTLASPALPSTSAPSGDASSLLDYLLGG